MTEEACDFVNGSRSKVSLHRVVVGGGGLAERTIELINVVKGTKLLGPTQAAAVSFSQTVHAVQLANFLYITSSFQVSTALIAPVSLYVYVTFFTVF